MQISDTQFKGRAGFLFSRFTLSSKVSSETIYLFSLAVFVFVGILNTSLLVPAHISVETIFSLVKFVAFLSLISLLWGRKIGWKFKITIFLAVALSYLLCRNSQNYEFFYYAVFAMGALGVRFEKILRVYLGSSVLGICSILCSCALGIIPNQTFSRQGISVVRNSFGFLTPTDFAARIFFVLLTYYLLRKFKPSWKEHLFLVGLIFVIYYLTNARLATLLLIILLVSGLIFPSLKHFIQKLGNVWLFTISFIYMLLSVLVEIFYTPKLVFFNKLNTLVSGRIALGNRAIREKGFAFWGQEVSEQGNGRKPGPKFDYFFIDSSYLRLLIISGVVISVIMLVVVCFEFSKFSKNGLAWCSIALVLIIVGAAVDHHFLDLSYNAIFLSLFANFNNDNQSSVLSEPN